MIAFCLGEIYGVITKSTRELINKWWMIKEEGEGYQE